MVVSVPVVIQPCPAGNTSNAATVTALCLDQTEIGSTSVNADCPGLCVDFTVVKNCLTDPVVADSNAIFEIIVTNTGDIPLDFWIEDAPDAPFLVGPIAPGATWEGTVERVPGDCGVDVVVSNTVIVLAIYGDGQELGPKEATAVCPVPCEGNEGCTPGFWKNHPDCWCDAYIGNPLAADIFEALGDPNYIDRGGSGKKDKWDVDTDTLMDALKYGGGRGLEGAVRNMLRHATAALLNECNDNVNYPSWMGELVIDLVNGALESEDIDMIQEIHGVLAGFNEDNPCPINAHCEVEEDDDEVSID